MPSKYGCQKCGCGFELGSYAARAEPRFTFRTQFICGNCGVQYAFDQRMTRQYYEAVLDAIDRKGIEIATYQDYDHIAEGDRYETQFKVHPTQRHIAERTEYGIRRGSFESWVDVVLKVNDLDNPDKKELRRQAATELADLTRAICAQCGAIGRFVVGQDEDSILGSECPTCGEGTVEHIGTWLD